jgi:hypothetical protein
MSHRSQRTRQAGRVHLALAGSLGLLLAAGCTASSPPGPPERPGERHPGPQIPFTLTDAQDAIDLKESPVGTESEAGAIGLASPLQRWIDDLDGRTLADWLRRLSLPSHA